MIVLCLIVGGFFFTLLFLPAIFLGSIAKPEAVINFSHAMYLDRLRTGEIKPHRT